jgi:hypothetical protein
MSVAALACRLPQAAVRHGHHPTPFSITLTAISVKKMHISLKLQFPQLPQLKRFAVNLTEI